MKFVVFGVGNRLRGDDAIGPEVIDFLEKQKPADALLIDCGSVPENFIGKIKKFSPARVVIVDAVDMKETAGAVEEVKPKITHASYIRLIMPCLPCFLMPFQASSRT